MLEPFGAGCKQDRTQGGCPAEVVDVPAACPGAVPVPSDPGGKPPGSEGTSDVDIAARSEIEAAEASDAEGELFGKGEDQGVGPSLPGQCRIGEGRLPGLGLDDL
jgi:hypothetical protein